MREDALADGPPVARSDAQERLEGEAGVAPPTAEAVAVRNGGRAGALAADGAKVVGCSSHSRIEEDE